MNKITKIIPNVLKESFEIEQAFGDACLNNDFKKVKELLNSSDAFVRHVVYVDHAFNNPLENCVKNGKLEMLKYLTSSQELLKCFEIKNADKLFRLACMHNHVSIIDYLLNQPKIDFSILPEGLYSQGITIAVENGHLDTLKYFRRLPNRNREAEKMEAENLFIFHQACEHNYPNIIQYLIEEPQIDNYKLNLRDLEKGFNRAVENNTEIIEILIVDLNIPRNYKIQGLIRCLTIEQRDKVENLFKLREVNQSLNNELIVNNNPKTIKKMKV